MHEDSLRFGGFSKGAWPLRVWEKKILYGRCGWHWEFEKGNDSLWKKFTTLRFRDKKKKKNTLFEKSSKHWDLAIKEEDSFGGRTLLEGEIEKSSLWLETIIRLFLERHT